MAEALPPFLTARRRLILGAAAALLPPAALAQSRVNAWYYYHYAPFELETGGLIEDVATYLNTALKGQYQLRVQYLPRPRLNLLLQRQEPGVIMLAASTVFGGAAYKHYLWSQPFMADHQELLSNARKPIDYSTPDQLTGIELGTLRGHHYPSLNKAIQRGTIIVRELDSQPQLLEMLLNGRVDVITMNATSLEYLLHRDPQLRPQIHRASRPLDKFTRHLLFTPGQQSLRDTCDAVLKAARSDPQWHALFRRYGLSAIQKTASPEK